MVNKKDFEEMRKEIEEYDEHREALIKETRDIIKLSKQIIYSIHRNELKIAEKNIDIIKKRINELAKKVKKDPKLDIGSFKAAVQEYVEAVCYYYYVKSKKLPTRKELNIGSEYYLLGICDLTGELVRNAVNSGIKGETNKAIDIKEFVEQIYDELMQFDFRNSELRKKVDQVKWDLKKLDDVVFSLKIKKKK
jgi:predicted translin family RNA/ssDNA-binding protein